MDIVNAIKQYRMETGINLADLAVKCNVSYPTLQRIATGKRQPSVIVEGKIRKVVG